MLIWYFVAADIFFAFVAVYFSFRYEKKTDQVGRQQKEINRRVFELSLLQSITEKIGYSLNLENISETIALTVENLFELTTVSYAIRQDGTVKLKTFAKEPVAAPYIDQVSKMMMAGMASIEPGIVGNKVESVVVNVASDRPLSDMGKPFDTVVSQNALQSMPQSFFNIPLILDNKLIGMINVSSIKKITYSDEDTALLFKIVNTAQNAIQRLHSVIKSEEAKLDSLILSLPFGTVMFTVENNLFKLSVINQAASQFLRLGLNPGIEEVLARFGQDLKLGDNIKNVFTSKATVTIQNTKIFDRDFTIFINPVFFPTPSDGVSSSESPADSRGKLLGVALIMRDVTPERKLEKIRTDFTDMMVHELRAPLTAIRGAAALIISNSLPPADRDKMPRIILDSSNDMLSTVSDFLDVAKIDEGKFKLTKMKSDLARTIGEHVDVFAYAAREKNITINFDKNTSPPEFLFDPIRVGQVINNLLSNSIKFTNEGGKIDVKVEPKDGKIEVMVTDNGIGIPENKKAVLFTKFGQIEGDGERIHRVNPSTGSSGLGLFISREIVEAHGGKIWLESTENVGTVVHFTLPLITEEKAAAAFVPPGRDYGEPKEEKEEQTASLSN